MSKKEEEEKKKKQKKEEFNKKRAQQIKDDKEANLKARNERKRKEAVSKLGTAANNGRMAQQDPRSNIASSRSSSRYGGLEEDDLRELMGEDAYNEMMARPARTRRSSSRPVVGEDLLRMFREAEENAESSRGDQKESPSRGDQKESPSRGDQKESVRRRRGRTSFREDGPDWYDDPCEGADDINAPRPQYPYPPNVHSDCFNCDENDFVTLDPITDIPLNKLIMLPSGRCMRKEDAKEILKNRYPQQRIDPLTRAPLSVDLWTRLHGPLTGGKKGKSKKSRKVKKTMKKHKKTKKSTQKNQHEKINKKRKSIKKHLRK